ncbi:MAG: DUF1559 domain-containing protein [Planctomycetaceae bacterium]|nr:DUF1559 domain-containing protein [Planctomycetaceae bacterium]
MPAIQAAREAARRAQCTSNQSQVAFALLNYEHTHGRFPALRAPLRPNDYWANISGIGTDALNLRADLNLDAPQNHTELTWVAFLLPFMEQNTAWSRISNGTIIGVNVAGQDEFTLYDLVLPTMQCGSSGRMQGETKINYVANAGPQNWPETYDDAQRTEYWNQYRNMRDARTFTIFFDHFAWEGAPWRDHAAAGTRRAMSTIRLEDISAMDGTSMTILITENENAGNWIWRPNIRPGIPVASHLRPDWNATELYPFEGVESLHEVESLVGFCFPYSSTARDEDRIHYYQPLENNVVRTDGFTTPLFINEGRANSGVEILNRIRTARPSSGHPGVVLAAFCDRSVRPLNEDMDKLLFIQISRPGSGVILNPRDLE